MYLGLLHKQLTYLLQRGLGLQTKFVVWVRTKDRDESTETFRKDHTLTQVTGRGKVPGVTVVSTVDLLPGCDVPLPFWFP